MVVPVKKFQFKPAGHVSVSKVIKKVGIFNADDDEEEDSLKKQHVAVIPEKKVNAKWLDEDEEEEDHVFVQKVETKPKHKVALFA